MRQILSSLKGCSPFEPSITCLKCVFHEFDGGFYGSNHWLYGRLTHDRVTYPALANGATVDHFFDYEWHGNVAKKGDVWVGLTPFITS